MKNVLLLFCFCFVANVAFSQPPILVTNSTSSGNLLGCRAYEELPIIEGKQLVLRIDHGWQINVVDISASLEYALTNPIVSIEYDEGDGVSASGLPIWYPGTHKVTIEFAFDIEPTFLDDIVRINVFIENGFAYPRFPIHFDGFGCFKIGTGHSAPISDRGSKSKAESIKAKMENEKSKTDEINGIVLSDINSTLRLDVKNDRAPITVFLTNIGNPNVSQIVLENRNLDKGVYDLPLANERLPFGIYQLVIQQGRNIQTIKYFHSP